MTEHLINKSTENNQKNGIYEKKKNKKKTKKKFIQKKKISSKIYSKNLQKFIQKIMQNFCSRILLRQQETLLSPLL